jgi:hypothetical protein
MGKEHFGKFSAKTSKTIFPEKYGNINAWRTIGVTGAGHLKYRVSLIKVRGSFLKYEYQRSW